MYADDTVLYFSHASTNNIELVLNSDLENVFSWMCKNKLSVNCQKTECILFGSKRMLSKQILHKSLLNQVRHFRYLGLICDEIWFGIIILKICLKKSGIWLAFWGDWDVLLVNRSWIWFINHLFFHFSITVILNMAQLLEKNTPINSKSYKTELDV